MIHTGEYHLHKERLPSHDQLYTSLPSFVPLKLRANDSPALIGTYPRHVVRDYCFMGGGYKRDWLPSQEECTGLYHQVFWDNYLPYEERKRIYLSSMFGFAFQSPENIQTGHLSQRIFEGLAYGCIVLCENKLAEEFTNGAVVHVSSKEDLVAKMRYYKAHPELVLAKQQQGYEWVKQHGTNRASAALFLHAIKERFQETFEDNIQSKELVPSTTQNNMHDTLVSGVKAHIDIKKKDGDLVFVQGWAFSETRGVCPLRCKYDSTISSLTIESRKDVCDLFQKTNVILSGWNVRLPLGKYVDLQIKLGGEWVTFLSFHTLEMGLAPEGSSLPAPQSQTEASPPPAGGVVLVESAPANTIVTPKQASYPKELEHFIQESLQDFLKKNPQANLSNTSVSLVNFSANPVHLSNVYVIDNYYQHPADIRNVALSYITHQKMSQYIKDVPAFQKHFEKIIGANIQSFSQYEENGTFSYTTSKDVPVVEKKPYQYAGVLFLTPNPPADTGITLYEGNGVNTIANVYNRLVIFNANLLHSITTSFGDDATNGRLVQVFAFNLANSAETSNA